jgi:MAP/microtubule affinity-regulating kinase
VKIYDKEKLMEPSRKKSVIRETKIMERLDHPNIAKLYEAFESQKQVFIFMEYVNGGSLHGYLKTKPNRQMQESEAKFLWSQVLKGIDYCHSRNVCHRDVKLENILLDETKSVARLIDFGFSTCIPHERKVKMFCGTPSYMAPEIVSRTEYSGAPADIWALGVLLFALLCGKFPFKGANDKELYSFICTKEILFPDHVSTSARKFLAKIFLKDPSKRPTSRELLKDPWLNLSDPEK